MTEGLRMQKNYLTFPISVGTARELERLLANTNVVVPSRIEGRAKEHREDYCLLIFLRKAFGCPNNSPYIKYPMSMARGQAGKQSDYVFEAEGKLFFGLEHTDTPDEAFNKYLTKFEQRGSPMELLPNGPWMGDAPERRLTELVGEAISNKFDKIKRRGSVGCERQDLLIYVNFSGGPPILDMTRGVAYVREGCREVSEQYRQVSGGGAIHLLTNKSALLNVFEVNF